MNRLHDLGLFHKVLGSLDPHTTHMLQLTSKHTKRIVNNTNVHNMARVNANAIARSPPSKKVQRFIDALRAFRRLTIRCSRVKIPVQNANNLSRRNAERGRRQKFMALIDEFIEEEPVLREMHQNTSVESAYEDRITVDFGMFQVDYLLNGSSTALDDVVNLFFSYNDFSTFDLDDFAEAHELLVEHTRTKTKVFALFSNTKIKVKSGLSLNQIAVAARDITAIERELLTFGVRTLTRHTSPTTQAEFRRLSALALASRKTMAAKRS